MNIQNIQTTAHDFAVKKISMLVLSVKSGQNFQNIQNFYNIHNVHAIDMLAIFLLCETMKQLLLNVYHKSLLSIYQTI